MYTPAQFAKKVNVSVKTIQKWDRLGILPAKRTITDRRYYTEEDLAAALRLPRVPRVRHTIAYCRVSSQAQKPDLENQKRLLEQYCREMGIRVDEWITEIGGGMNFKRKHFLRLVDAILAGEVERIVLAHQDRLARFAYSLLVHLCETHHCELVVMNTEQVSPEQELVQDLITITHCFSSRLYGLRSYRKALEKAIKDDQSAQNTLAPHA
jgi:predicted site-specific integrase-resolvase